MFFLSKGVPIDEIIEGLVDRLCDKAVQSDVEWQDAVDELSDLFFKGLKSQGDRSKAGRSIFWLCELTANYFMDVKNGGYYKTIYDFLAKKYPKPDIAAQKLHNGR